MNLFERIKSIMFTSDRYMMLLNGLKVTVILSLFSVIIGIILGTIVAIIKVSHQNRPRNVILKLLNVIVTIYVQVIRGTPTVVQLLIMNFIVFASSRNPVGVAILCFGINSGAYVSEIMRAGINAVDYGQTEAGRSLGLSYFETMKSIILPQAIKNILPALGNEFIMITKDTSLASTFFIGDLMTQCLLVKGTTYLTIEPLVIVAAIYFTVTFILSKLVAAFERRLRRGDVR